MREPEVFEAPWQAQAFAMAVALHERGAFTWKEWADTLAQVIREEPGAEYYRQWMTSLERLVAGKGLVAAEALAHRRHEWEEAAHRTPHGQPIELGK